MNDTFLSIENATGVAGWEIRAGLCIFPPTGRGARLTTNLWSIKKMTDASGNVCSLSPEVSVYSCLWMICPWWLFQARSEFIWLQINASFPHCKPGQDTSQPVSQSSPLHSQQIEGDERQYWNLLLFSTFCLPVHVFITDCGQLADTFILYWWSTFMPPVKMLRCFCQLWNFVLFFWTEG